MDINKKFEELMKDMQENIKDPKELEYINTKLVKMFLEIISEIEERNLELNKRISKIEEELFIPEDGYEGDILEIICPYCNYLFGTEIDDLKTEVTCPECNNVIELDWEDECGGDCSCCHGDCCEEDNQEEE